MSIPISGAGASIQLLKAQQAWAARQAARSGQNEPINASASPDESSVATPARSDEGVSAPIQPGIHARLQAAIPEIQEIARRAGFIDVSAQDIQRAYMRGESLLTDYRV